MNFRAIDVSHLPAVVPVDQPVPQLMWVNIADLVIDDAYQRPLSAANWVAIQKIAADFNWGRFTPVQVAPVVGGKFALIDGQHRSHAAALCGYAQVPAMSVVLSAANQAAAFSGINGQVVRISALQMYRAALAAGQDWAVRVDACVAAAGCQMMQVNPSAKNRKARQVYCVGLIGAYVKAGHGRAVTAALAALAAFDGTNKAAFYSDYILGPWIGAVADHPAHLTADLVAVLRAVDPFKIVDAGRNKGGAGSPKSRSVALWRQLINRQINGAVAA